MAWIDVLGIEQLERQLEGLPEILRTLCKAIDSIISTLSPARSGDSNKLQGSVRRA